MHFSIPEGFEPPMDAEPGGEFTAVGTFRDNQDGTLTLVAIDDAPIMEAEDDKEEAKTEIEIEIGGGKGGKRKGMRESEEASYETEADGMMRRAMEQGLMKRGM